MTRTQGRVALVTGGTRGIGEAIARRLARDGFSVFVSGRSEESVAKAFERFASRRARRSAVFAPTRGGRTTRSASSSRRPGRAGGSTYSSTTPGSAQFAPVDELSSERFRAVLETNLFGPFYAIRHAAPLMKKNGGGFVVNIASLAGVNAFAGGSAYNASKFGLLGFSDAAMLDLRHQGIRVADGAAGLGGHRTGRTRTGTRTCRGCSSPRTSPKPSRTSCVFRIARSHRGSTCGRPGLPEDVGPQIRPSLSSLTSSRVRSEITLGVGRVPGPVHRARASEPAAGVNVSAAPGLFG